MILNDITTLDGIKQDMYFLGKFSAATFVQNDLNRIINKYYKIVQENIRAVNEDFFLISTRSDLQPYSYNNGAYTFPVDYEKIKSYWVALQPANVTAPLFTEYQRCNVIDANAVTDPSYVFSQPTIVNFGSYFVLYPELTSYGTTTYPVTNGMKIYYIPQQPDLTTDNSVPNIFSNFHDIITWGSLIDVAERKGDATLLKKAQDRFDTRLAQMKADLGNRILDPEVSIVEGQDLSGGWAYPFPTNQGN